MTSSIFLKKSFQSGTTPAASEITSSELAINLGDGGLYYRNATSSLVDLIRAGTSSFAFTASFAENAATSNSGSFTGSFTGALLGTASAADHAAFAVTAAFALNAGAGGTGGDGQISGTLAFGTNVRTDVPFTSSIISSGSFETGSINLGSTFVIHRVSSSARTRVRLYSSISFRDADLSRAIGTDPTGEHGVILDAVLSGSPNFFVLDLAPYVIGADAKTIPDGIIGYTLNDLAGVAESKSIQYTRLEFEAAFTGTILNRDTMNLTTALIASGATETGSVELAKAFELLRVSASSDSRIRLYTTPGFRDADLSRQAGVDPIGEHGVILDLVLTGSFLDWQLAPLVLGASLEATPTESIAYSVQNRTTTPRSVSIDFRKIINQDQPVITTGSVTDPPETASFASGSIGRLAGSGTFKGDFTGTLAGTATTASNANTASFANPSLFTAHVPIKTVADTNPYTVIFPDRTLLIDASSGSAPIIVQLPGTALFMKGPAGKIIHVTKIDAGANNVEVLASGSETVIGDPSASLTDQYQGVTLQPSGGTWWVL